MSQLAIDSQESLKEWFRRSGVAGPLQHCTGPLPFSGAAIVRWSSDKIDASIQTIGAHADNYRIAVMLEPLESQMWIGDRPIWGGMIGANRFRICPPGSAGRWRRQSPCDIVNIFIPTATVHAMGTLRGDLPEGKLTGNWFTPDRYVLDLVWKMLDARALAGPLASQFCDGLIAAMVGYLFEHHAQPVSAQKTSSLGGARLHKLLARISEEMAEGVSIAELADYCGMSESHFSREFKKAVGLPPHQYVLKLRLDRAGGALLASKARIIDIALDLGFTNVSHFSRAFALRYGMPPAEFRRQQACGA
jgi:AraC family transcriptional regulator